MYKTREEIEKEFDKKFVGYDVFDDSLTKIIMDYVNEIKLYIHQISKVI